MLKSHAPTQTNKNLATNAIKGVVKPFTGTYESEI